MCQRTQQSRLQLAVAKAGHVPHTRKSPQMDHKTPIVGDTAAIGGAPAVEQKSGWKSRITHEVRQFLRLFLYLYAIFGLFLLHESVVLARYDIRFTRYGFALATALVLAKVMLVLEDFNIARGFESRPPIYSIVYKSVVYAVVFMAFYILEEIVGGLLRGEALRASVPAIARGTPQGILIALVIVSCALVPYFTFKELGKILGEDVLHVLLFERNSQRASNHGAQSWRTKLYDRLKSNA